MIVTAVIYACFCSDAFIFVGLGFFCYFNLCLFKFLHKKYISQVCRNLNKLSIKYQFYPKSRKSRIRTKHDHSICHNPINKYIILKTINKTLALNHNLIQ